MVIFQEINAESCIPLIALVWRNQDLENRLEINLYQSFPEEFFYNRKSLSVSVPDFYPLSFPFLSCLLPFYFVPLTPEPLQLKIPVITSLTNLITQWTSSLSLFVTRYNLHCKKSAEGDCKGSGPGCLFPSVKCEVESLSDGKSGSLSLR